MGWKSFGKRSIILTSNLPLTEEEVVQSVCTSSWCGNFAPNERPGEKSEKCTKLNGDKSTGDNVGEHEASIMY